MTGHRAIVFIDGNNFYHRLKEHGVDPWLDYAKVSRKLAGARPWVGARYYVGQMPNTPTYARSYAAQRKFIAYLKSRDSRMTCHFGRMEFRRPKNLAAAELMAFLDDPVAAAVSPEARARLADIARRHANVETLTEKAVDVMLSVDLVELATKDAFDDAYILSADGDYTPAVAAVRAMGKRVLAASLPPSAQLAASVNTFIPLTPSWFNDCR
jgi:uncharacterized LabA/DUF88 family protein